MKIPQGHTIPCLEIGSMSLKIPLHKAIFTVPLDLHRQLSATVVWAHQADIRNKSHWNIPNQGNIYAQPKIKTKDLIKKKKKEVKTLKLRSMVNTDHIGCVKVLVANPGGMCSQVLPGQLPREMMAYPSFYLFKYLHSKNRERDCSTVASAAVNSHHGNNPHMNVDYCNKLPPNEWTS